MQYSLEKVSITEVYDALLASAQKEKQRLERRRLNLGESIGRFSKRIDEIAGTLASVQLMLQALTTVYHGLPEGKDKLCVNVDIARLEVRKARLAKKSLTYNVPALLAKQVAYNRLGSQVATLEAYITIVEARKLAPAPAHAPRPAASFSRSPVVPQKTQSEKRVYRSQRLFFRLYLKSVAVHRLQTNPASLPTAPPGARKPEKSHPDYKAA